MKLLLTLIACLGIGFASYFSDLVNPDLWQAVPKPLPIVNYDQSTDLAELVPKERQIFVKVNGNIPIFTANPDIVPGIDCNAENRSPEVSKVEAPKAVVQTYEHYSDLDSLGRVGIADAVLGPETLPNTRRGKIGSVKPSGWHQASYDFIKSKFLYERSHLIAFQLAAENANPHNLMTGTHQLNQAGMTKFEQGVADYIKQTGNHVHYRVTPWYRHSELVPRGVQMEAKSIEDEGEGICFNVFIFNIQPGVEIDYATGLSKAAAPN